VYGLSRYRVDAERSGEADVPPALVLGFGNVNEDRIRRGVEVLGRILSAS
jgi:DNA-binding transcriptional MocR family regulator